MTQLSASKIWNKFFIRENWNQIVPIAIIGSAFSFFVISTVNYSQETWFPWLICSRVLMGMIGIGLVLWLSTHKVPYPWVDTAYITLGLGIQASHGLLESATSIEFYQFTGFFYIVAALSYKGPFKTWLKTFFPIQLFLVLFPIAVKERILHHNFPQIVDIYSITIASLFIGTVLARLSATKHDALIANLKLQEALLEEHKAKEEKYYALAQLATQVAHDIRSPLSSLQASIEYLGNITISDPRAPEILNLLELSAKRLSGIADGLLKKYKDDVSQNIIFSLHKVLDELVGEFKGQEKYRQVGFIKRYHSNSIEVYGESAKLQRAFGNIIKNAMEAMHFSGQIAIETMPEKESAVISIKDNGPGMNKETLDKVLAGGFTKGKEEGHGIGVTVAREVTKQFHGTFWADSEIGKGTTFYFQLPLPKVEALKTADREFQAMKEFVLSVTGNEPIVIIDDEPSMREQWRMVLAKEGIMAETYACYEEYILRQAQDERGQTAIIDYHFDNSELNGIEIIKKLKGQGFDNLYLCTAEYWKPSVQKMAKELGVALCPKPLPKIVVTPLLCKEGQGEVDQSLCSTPSNSPLQRGRSEKDGYTVLVIDDDPMIRMSWQMIQKKLEIGKLYSFESLEALKKTDGIDFAALDFAFVDKNIENSAFDGSQVIDFLKAKGVAKVILASGENEDRLRTDPQFAKADFVIGLKVPVSLKQFFS